MNGEFPSNNPRAELEARLTAFILGELPAHDAAALRQAMDEDVELAALYERLKTASKLVREVAANPIEQTKEPSAPLRLSEERRQKLLAQFKTVAPKEFVQASQPGKMGRRILEIAAVLAMMGVLAGLLLPSLAKSKSKALSATHRLQEMEMAESRQTGVLAPRQPPPEHEQTLNRNAAPKTAPRTFADSTSAPVVTGAVPTPGKTTIVLPPVENLADTGTSTVNGQVDNSLGWNPGIGNKRNGATQTPSEQRVFQLKNADAKEMASEFSTLFPDGGVVVKADPHTGTLTVNASKEMMPQLATMVEGLDSNPRNKQHVMVPNNAEVTDVQPVLQDLFNSGKTSGSSTSGNTPQNSALYQRSQTLSPSFNSIAAPTSGGSGGGGNAGPEIPINYAKPSDISSAMAQLAAKPGQQASGGAAVSTTNYVDAAGDPDWIGFLEHPDQKHSSSNGFVGRSGFVALSRGGKPDVAGDQANGWNLGGENKPFNEVIGGRAASPAQPELAEGDRAPAKSYDGFTYYRDVNGNGAADASKGLAAGQRQAGELDPVTGLPVGGPSPADQLARGPIDPKTGLPFAVARLSENGSLDKSFDLGAPVPLAPPQVEVKAKFADVTPDVQAENITNAGTVTFATGGTALSLKATAGSDYANPAGRFPGSAPEQAGHEKDALTNPEVIAESGRLGVNGQAAATYEYQHTNDGFVIIDGNLVPVTKGAARPVVAPMVTETYFGAIPARPTRPETPVAGGGATGTLEAVHANVPTLGDMPVLGALVANKAQTQSASTNAYSQGNVGIADGSVQQFTENGLRSFANHIADQKAAETPPGSATNESSEGETLNVVGYVNVQVTNQFGLAGLAAPLYSNGTTPTNIALAFDNGAAALDAGADEAVRRQAGPIQFYGRPRGDSNNYVATNGVYPATTELGNVTVSVDPETKRNFFVTDADTAQNVSNMIIQIDRIGGSNSPNVLHYNQLRIDSETEYARQEKLLEQLKGMNKEELKKTLPKLASDPILTQLLQAEADSKKTLAALKKDLGPNHPDVQRTEKLIAEYDTEADTRVEGIVKGLEINVSSLKAQAKTSEGKAEAKALTDAPLAKPAAPAPVPRPEVTTSENAFSTFSLNIADVSFKLAAASLEKGQMPEPASIRSEEFINAFDYRDSEPAPGAPLGFAWERAQYPFAHNRDLLRFSVKTAAAGREPGRPMNIVLLLDKSGSMERADRVRIIHEALQVLATQLGPEDKLSVVTFARVARLWVDGLPGSQAGEVADGLDKLTPEGGTNLEEAMRLAYETARRHYIAGGINRVVLLTDGAANLGNVDPDSLKQKADEHRKEGIALDCFGIGWEGYNDDLMEVLSRNGGGRYGFLNTPEEAASDFAGQLAGALHVAASDVKVQVEFNPKRVTAYRQIGYAKLQLTKEQFRDNTVNAAQIGAAESGNALYTIEVNPNGEGPLATVRVRYKVPGTEEYPEHEFVVPYTGNALPLEQASPAMRLAATASAFSESLAASPFAGEVTTDQLLGLMRGVPETYGADERPKKLEWMIRQAKSLTGK